METPQPAEAEWQSPCIGVCRLGDDGRCIGCRRTMEEIKQAYERLQALTGRRTKGWEPPGPPAGPASARPGQPRPGR